MKSRFKYGAYIVVTLTVVYIIMFCLALLIDVWIVIPLAFYIVINVTLVCLLIWVIGGELRTKVISVDIGYDNFDVKRYFGMGAAKTYYFNEITGYKISILPASQVNYEYLYVMAGDKKVIKLSEFYHKNYTELKEAISSAKIEYLGFEDFSYSKEFKEIFI